MINREQFEKAFGRMPPNIQWSPKNGCYLEDGKWTPKAEQWGAAYAGFKLYGYMVESDEEKLAEALTRVCDCIMETRGPNANDAVANARELLEEFKKKRVGTAVDK